MNPFEMQKKLFEDWEKNLSKYLESTMRQPEFMKVVGKNLESSMDLQGAVKRQVQKTLKALAIPTDDQLEGLYKTVNDLESRVLDLEEQVEDLTDALAERAPKRAARKSAAKKPAAKKAAPKRAAKKSAAKKPAAKKAAPKRAAKKSAAKKPAAKKASKKPAKK